MFNNPMMMMNSQQNHTVKKELQLCPNLDLDLKPQKALRQRIKAFKQRQHDDLLNHLANKGQKNGDKAEAVTSAKASNEAEDA